MPKHIRNPDLPQQKKERYLLTDVLPTVFALHCLLDNLIMGDPRVKMPDRIQCKTDTHKADHGLQKCAVILSAQQTPMSCRVVLLGGHTHRPVLGRHRFAPARGYCTLSPRHNAAHGGAQQTSRPCCDAKMEEEQQWEEWYRRRKT